MNGELLIKGFVFALLIINGSIFDSCPRLVSAALSSGDEEIVTSSRIKKQAFVGRKLPKLAFLATTATSTLTATQTKSPTSTNTATRTYGQVWRAVTIASQADIPSGWRQATLAEMAILDFGAFGPAIGASSYVWVVGGRTVGSALQTNNNAGFEAMNDYSTTGTIWIIPDTYRCTLSSTIYRIVGEASRCSLNTTTMQAAGCAMACPDGFYGTAVPRCREASGNLNHVLIEGVCRKTPVEYNPMFESSSGIGSYDLLNSADVVFAFDYQHSGANDHIGVYRPGGSAFHILKNNNDGTFTGVFDGSTNGVDGYYLTSVYVCTPSCHKGFEA